VQKPYLVAIYGSPRRGGNTDTLLNEFLKGASSQRCIQRVIVPSELGISPCQGLNQCFKDGACVIKDGMSEILEEVRQASHLVVASPVYFMGPPASLKIFIDRFQPMWAWYNILGREKPDKKERKGFIIITQATKEDTAMYRPTLSILRAFLSVTQFSQAGELIAQGLDEKDDARQDTTLLRQAFEAGKSFITK